MRNNKTVQHYYFGNESSKKLKALLKQKPGLHVIFVDHFFKDNISSFFNFLNEPLVYFINTENEITTEDVDNFVQKIKLEISDIPAAIIGIGGGSTLDMTKAVANLLTNPGKAEKYQGWDLVKQPGVYKIGIPTLSGTGAESSRTCVMINPSNGLKLGMNSNYTIFDQLILDPSLTKTVPRDQYFYSGMDTYIHCFESLKGNYRQSVSDAYSREAMTLCSEVFEDRNMMSDENREKLMIASYFGGLSIANSYVGMVHPFSAGLSVVLGIHHCEANCIVMNAMEEFYPEEYGSFWAFADSQNINIKSGICKNLTDEQYLKLYESTILHQVPLKNALGDDFKSILTLEKTIEIFKKM